MTHLNLNLSLSLKHSNYELNLEQCVQHKINDLKCRNSTQWLDRHYYAQACSWKTRMKNKVIDGQSKMIFTSIYLKKIIEFLCLSRHYLSALLDSHMKLSKSPKPTQWYDRKGAHVTNKTH